MTTSTNYKNLRKTKPKEGQGCYHPMHIVDLDDSARTIKEKLLRFFKQAEFKHCHCGALVPELKFTLSGHQTWTFCCYQVRNWTTKKVKMKVPGGYGYNITDDDIAIETDYTKFGNYLTRKQKQ